MAEAPATRVRLAVVVAVSAALAVCSVGAYAQASAPPSQAYDAGATAAKKKKKRKKKCRQEDQSPVFNALSCRALVRTIPNSPPTPVGEERYDFCRNGTYRYRKINSDSDGQRYFTTTYRGRWKVISSTSGSAGVSGAIQYSVTDYRSVYNDGVPAETPPPSVVSQAIAFSAFGVDFAGGTFLLGKAPC